MEKDLTYTIKVTTAECMFCKESYKLYEAQKTGISLCGLCGGGNKLSKLITLPIVFKKIIELAEKKNKKIKDRLVVDVSELIEELQGTDNE